MKKKLRMDFEIVSHVSELPKSVTLKVTTLKRASENESDCGRICFLKSDHPEEGQWK